MFAQQKNDFRLKDLELSNKKTVLESIGKHSWSRCATARRVARGKVRRIDSRKSVLFLLN